ncbi:GAF domain-containing protein [Pediococcus argentinicus]|uniref:GAF domain-containing protein n=1 Tax=Pediococcus argentinicus TaxID=480391 RepID=UPI00338EE1E2
MAKPIDNIIVAQIDALLTNETNVIANLSNASALLKSEVDDLNWAGFYLYDETSESLDLGPFQGEVACMHIAKGAGVCGTALANREILRVPNVHEFPGHIACDSASNSEIVLPLIKDDHIIGVLDIDSPSLDRFTESDEETLTKFRDALLTHIDIKSLDRV